MILSMIACTCALSRSGIAKRVQSGLVPANRPPGLSAPLSVLLCIKSGANRSELPEVFASRSYPGANWKEISRVFSAMTAVTHGPYLPWHGRGREFESHQVHQNISYTYRLMPPRNLIAGVQMESEMDATPLASATGRRGSSVSWVLSPGKKTRQTQHFWSKQLIPLG